MSDDAAIQSRVQPALTASPSTEPAPSHQARYPKNALLALAVAASMVAAFSFSLWRGKPAPPSHTPSAIIASSGQQSANQHVVRHPVETPENIAADNIVTAAMSAPIQQPVVAQQSTPQEPKLVVIGTPGELNGADSAVPTRVIDALRRMGHRVDQQRGVMPVRLKDGRRVDVPYEQLDVQYPDGADFQ